MRAELIAATFNACFAHRYHTVMAGGAVEPLYLPPAGGRPGRVIYTRDYSASALHEAAHWCIAGVARRRVVDYGYWYESPPRSAQRQAAFFAAEVRSQALEGLFSKAAGLPFRVSVDNPDGAVEDLCEFEQRVAEAAAEMRRDGLAPRARMFATALRRVAR